MAGYILKRIARSFLSIIVVVFIIMLLVFQLMNRDAIFQSMNLNKYTGNARTNFKYTQWAKFGYLDKVTYSDYVVELVKDKISNQAWESYNLDNSKSYGEYYEEYYSLYYTDYFNELYDSKMNEGTQTVIDFKEKYSSRGYTIIDLKSTGKTNPAVLFASKDINIFVRLWRFFAGVIVIDTPNYAQVTDTYKAKYGDIERKIYFSTDYNGLPCIMGSGTKHRYLLYFDNVYPFVHQNFITLNLGYQYASGNDFFEYFTENQDPSKEVYQTLPDGTKGYSSYNYHERTFSQNPLESDVEVYGDTYTNVSTYKEQLSRLGYSFVIGIISTILVYLIGIPLGLLLALKKDKIADKIGNFYIIFIMAVPSLAYIYIFSFLGHEWLKLPNSWPTGTKPLIYVLPIISLALPSIATMMKWVRRYTIDQMTADYVKFARSQGFSEGEIYRKHILKNALIPIVQGIPASVLGALTGAIITEGVYKVPGMGKLLVDAINKSDNGVIVGISFFYALLSIVSLILGDVLMSKVDPRISFASGGGRK